MLDSVPAVYAVRDWPIANLVMRFFVVNRFYFPTSRLVDTYLFSISQMAICVNPDRRAVFHSDRKASTGLIEAARLAGTTAADMAMIKRADTDAQMEARSALLV